MPARSVWYNCNTPVLLLYDVVSRRYLRMALYHCDYYHIDLDDIGAISGISDSDRDVLRDIHDMAIEACRTDNPTHVIKKHGFRFVRKTQYLDWY